jgi:hypothetical protein
MKLNTNHSHWHCLDAIDARGAGAEPTYPYSKLLVIME